MKARQVYLRGLHTCPEAAIASHPDIARREHHQRLDRNLRDGDGYADPEPLINTFRLPRSELDEYAVFFD
ncbi:MAG: hypothetical protein A3G24_04355 [Betaproteobacteria bacterium RIFCSPLOWO2_12_FULL_62_13]|nr:MAG: hypothetical protein A3G24_04355 [Betaproteobacteria bacterium RIFCSPLOWO2_12_FULL_62_13]